MKRWLKDFLHNAIIHPLMVFLPVSVANELHDTNANWAFTSNRYDELLLEGRKRKSINTYSLSIEEVQDILDTFVKGVTLPSNTSKLYRSKALDAYLKSKEKYSGVYKKLSGS